MKKKYNIENNLEWINTEIINNDTNEKEVNDVSEKE